LGLEYKVLGNGQETLIIETGIGNSFYSWYPLIKEISNNFRVVLYHRAGYGKSPSSDKPRSTNFIVEELNLLIENLGVKHKFILMGHSFGGLCAQHFARMYPQKIKGLILVDSTSCSFNKLYELDLPVMKSLISIEKMVESNKKTSKKSKEAIKNSFVNMIKEYELILSESELQDFEEFITNPLLFKTIAEEFENWAQSSECIKEMGEFPNIPMKVIARDKEISAKPFVDYGIPKEEAVLYEECWYQLQVELSQLSSRGELIIADQSDHEIHKDRPDIIMQCLESLLLD
jgi:predicted alpha/beta hydrolase family esterase